MLARESIVSHNGRNVFRTPLLVPSFSSKGFPELRKIISVMSEFLTDAVLVSAYDAHYEHFKTRQLTFPSVIFLDSGGYEARVEHDLSEAYGHDYKPDKWTAEYHRDILAGWNSEIATVVVSFDSPTRLSGIERQAAAALELKQRFPLFIHEFLIKPERKNELLNIDRIKQIIGDLKEFPIIGFTERELDSKLIGRMEKIAYARRLLDDAGISSPIHIFGSLDTLSTPLYFASGAEIFDGLTWLRFGFHKGQTIYIQNYGAISAPNGILKNARESHTRCGKTIITTSNR